jgi:hypothetical protein
MKLYSIFALIAFATFATTSAKSSKDSTAGSDSGIPPPSTDGKGNHGFKLPKKNNERGPRGGFGLQKQGGRLQLCPSGDCTETVLDITMEKMVELDDAGKPTQQRVKNFKTMDFVWSAPVTTLNEEGVNVTTSEFEAILPVEKADTNITYKAKVDFYQGNGTALNGEQVIDVPAGALKFGVWIESWPFLSDNNTLHLGLNVKTRNKKGESKPKADLKRGRGRDKKIERLDLGDSLFLDSPILAEVDGEMKNISTTITANEGFVLIEYEFPKFSKMYYDPVLGSDESEDDITSNEGSSSGSKTTSSGSAAKSAASSYIAPVYMSAAISMAATAIMLVL